MLSVSEIKQEISHLSVDDKLLLINELCDSISKDLPDNQLQTNFAVILASAGVCGLFGSYRINDYQSNAEHFVEETVLSKKGSLINLSAIVETIRDCIKPKKSKLSEEAFVGMWRNRPDMQDSTEWVRNTRKSEWSKNKLQPTITKGDKTLNPTELFGLWKEQPKKLADIRKKEPVLYKKRNVNAYTQVIKKEFDENLCDEQALTYIQNSAEYIHKQRRQNSK